MFELPDVTVDIDEGHLGKERIFRRACDIDHTVPYDTSLVEIVLPFDPNAAHTTVKAVGTAKKLLERHGRRLHGRTEIREFLQNQPAGNTTVFALALASYRDDPRTYTAQVMEAKVQKVPSFIKRPSGIHHFGVRAAV